MRQPLLAVAIGLVIVALYSRAGGFDLLPDPIGWALVLGALRTVTRRVELSQRTVLWVLGIGALLAAAVLWWPAVHDWFADADPALGWAIDLPSLTFCGVLCHALSAQARAAGETFATGWLSWTAIGFAISAIAPAVVIGGGVESLRDPAGIVTGLAQVSLFVLCVVYAAKQWAGALPAAQADV